MLLQIHSSHFCAAVVLEGSIVTDTAPILKYMKNWKKERVEEYCRKKSWHVQEVGDHHEV